MRVSIALLAESLQPHSYALISTSRGLDAVIDLRFETQVKGYRWYAILSRGNHLQAAADVGGRRISLQRFVLTLADPSLSLDQVKQVSFANKLPFDCRLENISGHIGRTAVMRNRRSKSGTSSIFKGVIKRTSTSGQVRWAASIATKDIRYNLGFHLRSGLLLWLMTQQPICFSRMQRSITCQTRVLIRSRWSLCASGSHGKTT
jgi:hypothetical protein